MKNYTLLLFSAVMFIKFFHTSCSIEKRVYRKGYTIEWNGAKKTDVPALIEKNVASVLEKIQPRSSEIKTENTNIHMLLKLPYENPVISGEIRNNPLKQ